MTTALRNIFAKPVDRPIDGVIKADDEASLRIELDEYVITDEIGKRLETFLDAYNNYDTANGVWISGFFGSGKSHLLKMLALLMENREVDGTRAFDIFEEKLIDQPMLLGALRKAVSVPSKSILFNIDQKADVISKTDVDALLSVFQKVFDEACGYYGKLPHIAQFERDLDDRGQLAAFKDAYGAAAGKPWERGREQAALERKNIATAFASVTGGDPADAADILGQYRADTRVSIEDFANKVKAWIDQQAPKFRLNFFVDEVGQYIAENVKLMTNLQTIAESLNTKCKGQAWVIVTSQQDMEAIIGDGTAFQSQDFSKIMARFGVKMPLNSADVAEVIQRRLLSKTDEGQVRLGKGENFRETSRFRASMGDRVFRFAPTDWDRPTHRYNPLARIAAMTNPDRQQMELKLTAKLFLQTDNEKLSGLLAGGIDLFVAAGLLAFERGVPTIGEIYRITASGGDKQKEYLKRSQEVKNTSAKLIFERMASTNNDTLTSYLSLLMTSGLDTWDNRAIDAATATSDFSFRDIRRRPHAIYLVVESEMIRPLAPLIRLFFSDLIASLQAQEPGDDEPWPVMIMLDEFDRLGKMPIVAESIKTLRSFGGNLAIVTQTIPALDEIYGENTRWSLQGGAGVKLYLTPSEQKTIEELSQAVGKTTKRVVTRSRAVGRNPFEGRSVSERTEDTPLLTEDEARRMDLDEVILVIDAQMPIRARRVKYFEDPALNVLHAGQSGSFPYPDEDGLRRDRQMSETRETVDRLKQELQEVRAAAGARGSAAASTAAEEPATDPQVQKLASTSRARGRAARAAAPVGGSGQVSFDLDRLGIKWANRTELTAAVQTTKAIIAEHG